MNSDADHATPNGSNETPDYQGQIDGAPEPIESAGDDSSGAQDVTPTGDTQEKIKAEGPAEEHSGPQNRLMNLSQRRVPNLMV